MHIRTRKDKDGNEKYNVAVAYKSERSFKTFSDYAEAHAWATQEKRRLKYKPQIELNKRWLVSDVIREYSNKILPMKTKGTQANYTHILRWLNDRLGTADAALVRTRDFAELRDKLIAAGYKNNYIHKFFSCFNTVWNYAIKELEIIDVCYPKNTMLPKHDIPKSKTIIKEELDVVLKYATSHSTKPIDALFKAYIVVSIFTGLRNGEMMSISWDMINTTNRTIYFNHTKNGREHTVYLPSTAYDILMALPRRDSPTIFPNFYYRLKVFSKKHGLSHIHPHRFRHTACTLISESDISHIEQAKLMNHQNLQSTMGYTGQSIERKTELGNRLEERVLSRFSIS